MERGRQFLHSLRDLATRSAWDWRCCRRGGGTLTQRWGTDRRDPWFFDRRKVVRVQRHGCTVCRATYSERSVLLVRGWDAREVRRGAKTPEQVDEHGGGADLRLSLDALRQIEAIVGCGRQP